MLSHPTADSWHPAPSTIKQASGFLVRESRARPSRAVTSEPAQDNMLKYLYKLINGYVEGERVSWLPTECRPKCSELRNEDDDNVALAPGHSFGEAYWYD